MGRGRIANFPVVKMCRFVTNFKLNLRGCKIATKPKHGGLDQCNGYYAIEPEQKDCRLFGKVRFEPAVRMIPLITQQILLETVYCQDCSEDPESDVVESNCAS